MRVGFGWVTYTVYYTTCERYFLFISNLYTYFLHVNLLIQNYVFVFFSVVTIFLQTKLFISKAWTKRFTVAINIGAANGKVFLKYSLRYNGKIRAARAISTSLSKIGFITIATRVMMTYVTSAVGCNVHTSRT